MTRHSTSDAKRRLRTLPAAIALALALLFGLLYASYRGDIEQAYERVAKGSALADTPCGPIEYATAGTGPPILVVHGAGGGFDQGRDLAKALVDAGFRVVAMSRFGYLRTPLPADASAAAQADAHACLLDALRIGRAAVLGASAGAPSSIEFALRHPERCAALILLVPAAYAPRPGPPVEAPRATQLLFDTALKSDFAFWAAQRFLRETMIRALLATPPDLVEDASAEERRRIDDALEHILPVRPRAAGLMNDATVIAGIRRAPLERIAAPALVISVRDDLFGTYEGARYTAEHIAGARFIGYPSGGHLWVGHHPDIVREISAFLGAASH